MFIGAIVTIINYIASGGRGSGPAESRLLTEAGNFIVTESGNFILIEG